MLIYTRYLSLFLEFIYFNFYYNFSFCFSSFVSPSIFLFDVFLFLYLSFKQHLSITYLTLSFYYRLTFYHLAKKNIGGGTRPSCYTTSGKENNILKNKIEFGGKGEGKSLHTAILEKRKLTYWQLIFLVECFKVLTVLYNFCRFYLFILEDL